jgi:uncharacterized OB-fold protein
MSEKEITIKNYFDFLQDGKIMGSKCSKCSQIYLPPRKLCQKCTTDENMDWIELDGSGTLSTYSLVHVGARYFVNQGYSMKKPYCFGVVKMKDGPSISGHIVGVDESNPETIKVGMPLKAKFLKIEIEGKEPRTDLGFEPT